MKQKYILLIAAAVLFGWSADAQPPPGRTQSLSLAGVWKFKLDVFEAGISANGVQLLPAMAETITLPGSTDQAGKGYPVQSMTSLRLTRPFEYKGVAWYEKEIMIPADWKDKEVELFLERAHWSTELWVNGKAAGKRESLSVPHRYPITALLQPGIKNKILLKVNNDMIYNIEYAHATSAETQTNWNGVIGTIALNAFDKVRIRDLQVYPQERSLTLAINIVNATGGGVKGTLAWGGTQVQAAPAQALFGGQLDFQGTDSIITIRKTLFLDQALRTWDEFSPVLYRLHLDMQAQGGARQFHSEAATNFGFRTIRTKGTRFEINNRPAFIRGTVNCAEFPLTGYPPTDKADWLRMFRVCQQYGLNAMRFHTWCPPEAAFQAADELGFYLQVENADWRFTVGKDSAVNAFLKTEGEAILNTYGNHPSFIMFCEGNELVGPKVKEFLTEQVTHWKAMDPRRLYTGSAAYPLIEANAYNVLYGPRPHRWKEGLASRFNKSALDTRYDYGEYVTKHQIPIISHEVGQWCTFPNFDEIGKYTGVLKPYNYELFRELLREKNMLDQARAFTMASGKFKVIQNKEEVESYLRTPGLGGYHYLQMNDFPGQGTAPVGVVDIFWDPKPFTDAATFSRFQNKGVPLLRTTSFTWTTDQTFSATAQFANFDSAALMGVTGEWVLRYANGKVLASDRFQRSDIPIGSPFTLGEIAVPLAGIQQAEQLELTIHIPGTPYKNSWSFWVYPKQLPEVQPSLITIADAWSPRIERILNQGGKVLLLADTARIASDIVPCFSGISWNTVWSGMPPNLLGILCDPQHPALRHFPTESHSNWQWWDLVMHSKPMQLDHFPFGFKPLVQLIPDWNNPKKISLLYEARVGKGSLLVAAIDLKHHLDQRPVARQFLYSLKQYMISDDFKPTEVVAVEAIQKLFKP